MAGEVGGIRWGRALLAAFIVEVLLAVVGTPLALLTPDPATTLNLVVPPASFLFALLVVMWLFRRSDRPVANGVVTGVMCLALYVVLVFAAYQLAPEQTDFSQSLSLPYLASHALKIVGGAVGGWLIARKATTASAGTFK